MISLMLVAGERTDKLAKFLEDKGTFSVNYSYDSLSNNLAKIKDDIINVDKLLYLYQDNTVSVRADMQALKQLLTSNGFFKVEEIVLIVTDNTDKDRVISYFNAVMNESPGVKYSIKTLNNKPSFSEIYDNILGVSRSLNFKNSYRNVYRVERNDSATTAFEAQDDRNLKIEPFGYDSLASFEQAKINATKVESGIVHYDREIEFIQFDEPDFGEVKINSVLHECRTELFTGFSKSGVTTWCCSLAHSVKESQQKITIIDFSNNCDIGYTLKNNEIDYKEVSMLDLLKLYEPDSGIINLCSVVSEHERRVKLEFLKEFYSKPNLPHGFIFIVLPLDSLKSVMELIHNDVDSLFMGVIPLYCDLMRLQQILQVYDGIVPIRVFLNRFGTLLNSDFLEADKVKDLLSFSDVSIIDSVQFPTLKMNKSLANKLLEV